MFVSIIFLWFTLKKIHFISKYHSFQYIIYLIDLPSFSTQSAYKAKGNCAEMIQIQNRNRLVVTGQVLGIWTHYRRLKMSNNAV